jgi:hypothetical protein
MTNEIRPGRPDDDDGATGQDDTRFRPVYNEYTVLGGSRHPAAGPDVGRFQQADELSQWALRRYLLARAIGASVIRTVYWFGIAVLVLALLVWSAGVTWLAVLIGVAAVFILLFRALLSGIQRRISGVDAMGSAGPKVERLVGQTRKGIRAELRRIGLPASPWGPTLIGLRLIRPIKRVETVRKLSKFDLSQVVPSSTLDELYLLLRSPPPPVR